MQPRPLQQTFSSGGENISKNCKSTLPQLTAGTTAEATTTAVATATTTSP